QRPAGRVRSWCPAKACGGSSSNLIGGDPCKAQDSAPRPGPATAILASDSARIDLTRSCQRQDGDDRWRSERRYNAARFERTSSMAFQTGIDGLDLILDGCLRVP